MSYFAVTVTYGDRFKYLKQVIDSLLEQKIDKILIVSNGSNENSLNKTKELVRKTNNIELIDLKSNTGSANGFYQGIKYAYDKGAEYIWLLDDDNKPTKNSLKILKEERVNLINKYTNESLALLSYRNDRKIYSDAIDLINPRLMLGVNNSFLGFSLFNNIESLFKTKKPKVVTQKDRGIVAVAPYGGLFFHRDLISKIGFPDISYFLYGDDYDFTYRITKTGGKIFLIKKSKIIDLEKSFHLIKNKRFNTRYFNTDSKERIFYSVRNGIVFEQNFVSNKSIYLINASFYLLTVLLILFFYPKQLWKFKYIVKGVHSAIKKAQ
ncbi:glycosyltransferase [Mariniflexile sp. HMF6888]|uniref:glycosyltransferase n=1 Tax=Mariniflexile sp. HMF6888 TaxID=3373086 RepID=UPI00379A80AB